MSIIITRGFPFVKEACIETNLNIKDINTKVMALWGFYLIPKTRNSIWSIIVVIILCPFLLYLLYQAFAPYFF
jgi:hypothetical protein